MAAVLVAFDLGRIVVCVRHGESVPFVRDIPDHFRWTGCHPCTTALRLVNRPPTALPNPATRVVLPDSVWIVAPLNVGVRPQEHQPSQEQSKENRPREAHTQQLGNNQHRGGDRRRLPREAMGTRPGQIAPQRPACAETNQSIRLLPLHHPGHCPEDQAQHRGGNPAGPFVDTQQRRVPIPEIRSDRDACERRPVPVVEHDDRMPAARDIVTRQQGAPDDETSRHA